MNFEFAKQINPYLSQLDFDKALKLAQSELQKIPETDFHKVLDKSLTNQADALASWIEKFYTHAAKKNKIETLYFEMTEFDINTEQWQIDCFAFSIDKGLTCDDLDWLCNFDTYSQKEIGNSYKITGYEELQKAFEETELITDSLQNARDWCEQIIIGRFMELMREAHLKAGEQKMSWAKTPIYFTEHSYDFIVKSQN